MKKINLEKHLCMHERLVQRCFYEMTLSSLVSEFFEDASPKNTLSDQNINKLKQQWQNGNHLT